MKRIFAFSAFLAVSLVLAVTVAPRPLMAEERDGGVEEFSAYSVARLKLFEGTAWVRMPDTKEWEEFTTNSPIPEKSRISIPEGSEAELQFHGGQFVLLTSGTEVDVRRLDEEVSSFRLRSGEIRFDLPQDDFSPTRVAIPDDGTASFPVPGRYWLFVKDDGRTRLVVRSGEAVVTVGGEDERVRAGEVATIDGGIRVAEYAGPDDEGYLAPPPLTEEEARVDAPPAAVRELSDYGDWVYSNDYGYVWRPMVAEGWSPYYYGRWVWVFPFGWTWLSYEPWGWYPYHFGWWVTDPVLGWVWSPYRSFVSVNLTFGRARVRHYHRGVRFVPGNVRFVREGGNYRWVPLRPGERFVRFGIGRSDTRIVRYERPLAKSSIFYRAGGTRGKGKAEWRDWSGRTKDRRTVVVGPSRDRGGSAPRVVAPPGRERSVPVRERPGSVRPEPRQRIERGSQAEPGKETQKPAVKSAPVEQKRESVPSGRYEKSNQQGVRTDTGSRRDSARPGSSGSPEKADKTVVPEKREKTVTKEKAEKRSPQVQEQKKRSIPPRSDEDDDRDGRKSGRSR